MSERTSPGVLAHGGWGARGLLIAIAVSLAACASSAKAPAPKPAAEDKPAERLLQTARAESAAGRLQSAADVLERGLQMEPENARLWNELASVRLSEGRYAEAETLARRSNSHARGDFALRGKNWAIIAQAREKQGDVQGAATAYELAQRIGGAEGQ